MAAEVAKLYADALYEIFTEEGSDDSIHAQLNEFAGVFRDNPELTQLLAAPLLTSEEKISVRKFQGHLRIIVVEKAAEYSERPCRIAGRVEILDLAKWCGISFGGVAANPLWNAKRFYINQVEVRDLTIPDGVTHVGDYAFYQSGLEMDLVLPQTVKYVGYHAFYGTSITSVAINSDIRTYESDNMLISPHPFGSCKNLKP